MGGRVLAPGEEVRSLEKLIHESARTVKYPRLRSFLRESRNERDSDVLVLDVRRRWEGIELFKPGRDFFSVVRTSRRCPGIPRGSIAIP